MVSRNGHQLACVWMLMQEQGDMGRRIPSLVVGACLLMTAAAAAVVMRRVPTNSSQQDFQQSSSDLKKCELPEAYEPEPEA